MRYVIALIIITLYACGESPSENLGGVTFKRHGAVCDKENSQYWLLEIKAINAADSVFIDTRKIKRKAEINTADMRANTSFHRLLQSVCKGDSIEMLLNADSFYYAMKSGVPAFLEADEQITMHITVKDRLDPQSYAAYKRVFERESMKKYIRDFNWNAQMDSSTGIYYEMLSTDSVEAEPFKVAKFKYVLKNINEELIAFSKDEEPLELHADDSTILPGIVFLAKQLTPGESVRALVPSTQAYGSVGIDKVRPYMPIIVELSYIEKVE